MFEDLFRAARGGISDYDCGTPEDKAWVVRVEAQMAQVTAMAAPIDNMNNVAINRFDDAVAIQAGACNPSGVARALVRCINQCLAEKMDTHAIRSDAAIRLVVHQLADLCNVDEINHGSTGDVYGKLIQQCRDKL
jgi:hypothetical protein